MDCMDWIIFSIIVFLLIILALIFTTLYSLAPLGDERKNLIRQKAEAKSFAVVIVFLLIEIGFMTYTNLATNQIYEGLNPLITLIVISVVYLITLLRTKMKHGG